MRTFFKTCAIAALAFWTSVAVAETKIGVIDYQMVTIESNQFKAFEREAEERFGKKRAQLARTQKELSDRGAKIKSDAQSGLVPESELKAQQFSWKKDAATLKFEGQSLEQEIQKLRQQHLSSLKPQVDKAIESVISKGNYDLVVERRAVVYLGNNVDITSDVIRELNTKKK